MLNKEHKYPYTPKELNVVDEVPVFGGRMSQVRATPVTQRRNAEMAFYDRKPCYMVQSSHFKTFSPACYNFNLGRGRGADNVDVFGIQWTYEPTAGGSIVKGGNPILKDANDWKEVIKIPDLDTFDWEGSAKDIKLDPRFPQYMSFSNGFWFERLISFMDFTEAAMALIDDEQVDAINELFEATTEMGCKLVDKFVEYFPEMDCIEVHDDWGAQKAPFFSQEVAEELFVPHMKKLTDHIHSKGRVAMLHSCGHNEERVMCYINGGFDIWTPQDMNDHKKLYDEVGDKIIIGINHKIPNLAEMSEDDQRKAAREVVEYFNQPGKPASLAGGERNATPAFLEEVYEYSRKLYLSR